MAESFEQFEPLLTDLTSVSGTSRQRVISFCEGLYQSYIRQLPLVKLCYSIYYGTPQGAPTFNLEQYYDRILNALAGLVEDGIARGEIRAEKVSDIVWTIMSCLNITIEEQMCQSNPRIDGTSMNRMLNIVFNGIAKD